MKRLSDPNSRGRASSWTVSDAERRFDSSRTSLVVRGRGKVEKEEKRKSRKLDTSAILRIASTDYFERDCQRDIRGYLSDVVA